MALINITLNFIDAGNQAADWTAGDLVVVQGLGLAGLNTTNPQVITGRKNIVGSAAICSKWYLIFDRLDAAFELFSDAGVTAVTRDGACIGSVVAANAVTLYLKPKPPPVAVGPAIVAAVAAVGVGALSNLAAIQTYLGTQAHIRVYVPASLSRGHQTTTCLIVRRLIAWGYAGAFEVIYENQNNNAGTLQLLLPELNLPVVGQNITPGNYQSAALGNCVFTFDVRNDAAPPAAQRQFGISGGVDNPNDDPRLFCNVQYFLMLQPFQWNAANYLYPQGAKIDLGNEPLLDRLQFLGTTCYYQDLAPITWANVSPELARIGNANARAAVAGIQATCCVPAPAQLLMPVYGLARAAGLNVMSNWPALDQTVALANLVLAVLEGQGAAPLNQGTVLMVLDTLGAAWTNDLLALLPQNYHARLSFWTMGSAWANASITGLAANQILIVNLPGVVPSPIFNYFYLNSSLPPLFEGKGTMPVMLNSGRPYLQLSKQQDGFDSVNALPTSISPVRRLKPYLFPSIPIVLTLPTPAGTVETTPNAEAQTCLGAQMGIVWNAIPNVVVNAATFNVNAASFVPIRNYLIQNNFIDAACRVQLRFCALRNAADFDDPFPTAILSKAQMYAALQTACGLGPANICTIYQGRLTNLSTFFGDAITPASPLAAYFTALGAHFNDQTNDKLLKGMGFAVSAIAANL